MTGFGRLGEVANGGFADLHFAESGLADWPKRDRQKWGFMVSSVQCTTNSSEFDCEDAGFMARWLEVDGMNRKFG